MEINYTLIEPVKGNKKLKREVLKLFNESLFLEEDKYAELKNELATIGVWSSDYINSLLYLFLKYRNFCHKLSAKEERFVKYYIITANWGIWVEDNPYLTEYKTYKEKEHEFMFEPPEKETNVRDGFHTIMAGKNYLKYQEKADKLLAEMGAVTLVSLDKMYDNFLNDTGNKIFPYNKLSVTLSEDIKQDLLAEDLSDILELVEELYQKDIVIENDFLSDIIKNAENKIFIEQNTERILEVVGYRVVEILGRITTNYALNLLFESSFGKSLMLIYLKNMNRTYNDWHILASKKMHNEIKKGILLLKKSLFDSSFDMEVKSYYQKYYRGWWD